ncbi:glutathione S-transferase family protein [Sphingomonas sp. SRS2]|uniref:glutathione S-transferase family protein n=1 Tax=Sphingomonas sp. SRS2 TaxID=133190 RepID=UPI000618423C|nr:glutathione S-transferase family protein [Sphingomonas sp. SRS2]KKC27514.1 glutathione S-transferase [Sphingomonas sp. SRS2]
MITLYAFCWVPDFAKGHVRDLRVRWALEEAGIPYRQKLLSQGENGSPDYLALQPFGQVPAIEENGAKLFESGAIVLNIARRSEALMPRDPQGRARTEAWMFAALNSVEPAIGNLADIDLFAQGERWAQERRPAAVEQVQGKLDRLEHWLAEKDYLEDAFSAGDLLMSDVLRILDHTDIVEQRPVLRAYRDRCLARPAFRKALADQLASFEEPAAAIG